ncbi:MAG TPA: putative toxin-antitoxin system toxin component, PIN family [Bryobacteraceae bacterium]|nr:putative toxin-antitoxin system toxin component, PIN family [Bryobacteraceae bacterium]
MTRVVIDTNVVVSALLQPLGPSAAVFLLAAGGALQMCVSGDVYFEYEEVIRRPRLALAEEAIAATLQKIRERGLWVKPTETIKACSDPDDDIFLECAHAARADYLVTGNLKHFPRSSAGTLIVTPRSFLDLLLSEETAPTRREPPAS